MTISVQLTKRIYAGNGLTRDWEVDFPVSSVQDIRVFISSPQGTQTEIVSNYEYNATSQVLTYPTLTSGLDPLAAGWHITLVRRTPQTQEIDLLRQGELDAEVLEQGYDKLTRIVQELSEQVDRCMKYPVSTQSLTEAQTELTSAQLAALNSGITRSQAAMIGSPENVDIAQIETNKNNITLLQTAVEGKQAAGDYATNTALTTGLATKQDTISDLATIRSGASAGATALQPGSLATVATSGSYADLSNRPITITEAYANGTSWYRVYSDGWCEQGGMIAITNPGQEELYSVTFLKEYANTNYTLTNCGLQRYNASNPATFSFSKSVSGFSGDFNVGKDSSAVGQGIYWQTCGYIS